IFGATKLERHGAEFLAVITGSGADLPHPARRKLAGGAAATLYDRLMETQSRLARGADGCEKPLSCTASQVAKLAEIRPADMGTLTRLLGERRADRFGAAFLDVLAEG
ncbi:HRDC domain-containing protein, partial [Rhodovulum sulfidophilum]|uniref:HRDC domain-containing protein n=1 Tax=Rhodovulum sulfidophilum TaxID=35806 RepID=UPI002DD447CD